MTRATEAAAKPVTFTYDGHDYTVPPQPEWPIDVAEMVEDKKYMAAARLILGPQQWAAFKKRHQFGDIEAFFTALGEAIGGNPT